MHQDPAGSEWSSHLHVAVGMLPGRVCRAGEQGVHPCRNCDRLTLIVDSDLGGGGIEKSSSAIRVMNLKEHEIFLCN
jgi:hypothetical protein